MKTDKKTQIESFAEYIESGIEEHGRDVNLSVQANVFIKKNKARLPEGVYVFREFLSAMRRLGNLQSVTHRILLLFLEKTEFENFVSMDIKTIGEELLLSERSIGRGISQLAELNVIIKVDYVQDRRRNEYFLNPMAAWKGSSDNRLIAIKKVKEEKGNLEFNFPPLLSTSSITQTTTLLPI